MKQVFVAAVLALVLVPLAHAAGPVQSSTPWDRTRVIDASAESCPFAIQVHSTGTIHTWAYADGTVKTILQDFHIEWTNLETGRVATTPLGGPGHRLPGRDGRDHRQQRPVHRTRPGPGRGGPRPHDHDGRGRRLL